MAEGLRTIPLGVASSTGRAAVDHCIAFKRKLNEQIGRADSAWLVTTVEEGTGRRGVSVCFDEDVPQAERWARSALDAAPDIWDGIAKRAKVRERV